MDGENTQDLKEPGSDEVLEDDGGMEQLEEEQAAREWDDKVLSDLPPLESEPDPPLPGKDEEADPGDQTQGGQQ